jgi:hypothetical protein
MYCYFAYATTGQQVERLIVMDRVAGLQQLLTPADKRETHADFGPCALGRLPKRRSSSVECGESLVDHV